MASSKEIKNVETNNSIVVPEMGFFCFDVLYSQLYQSEPPRSPNFSDDAL